MLNLVPKRAQRRHLDVIIRYGFVPRQVPWISCGQVTLRSVDSASQPGSYLPAPVRLTVCGLFAAESVNVSVPVMVPFTAGVNVTLTVQLAPPLTLDPQVFAVIV